MLANVFHVCGVEVPRRELTKGMKQQMLLMTLLFLVVLRISHFILKIKEFLLKKKYEK